jgi:phospholipase/lecithinase/hemolysin
VAALATAGAELAGYVKNDILGRGAQYVVVQLAQDLSVSPFGVRLGPQTQALITAMTDAFNQQLAAGLAGTNAKVNDIRAVYRQWHLNPAANGFANTTTEACDKAKIAAATGGAVTDGPSLLCSKATLIDADTSRHLYADDVHPSAYGHQRLGELVEQFIESIGWL